MAKTIALLKSAHRNDRMFKAAMAGAFVYICTMLAVAPPTKAQEPALLRTADFGGANEQVATLQEIRSGGPVSKLRKVKNRPAYAAYSREQHCLATAIYFEARSESARGQRAVAEVILTRTRLKGRPKSICGVVYQGSHRRTGCQFSFACDGVADRVRDRGAWQRAQAIASAVMRTGGRVNALVPSATHYHANYVRPYWTRGMVKVAQIGSHIFYREGRRQG